MVSRRVSIGPVSRFDHITVNVWELPEPEITTRGGCSFVAPASPS
jgi:hypothetical protein